ncbi:MAG: hypothetical protein JOY86_07695 [Candidatus Eremiobacteraeota bacterium]|nr:hypothetical protein [Candidatus Eremiobacteraeota bacterium]
MAWAWPGVWLKSNYQLNDNTIIGANREGFRVHYALDKGPIEIHAQYGQYMQIVPSTLSNVNQLGFVDGFYLPQSDGFGTLGVAHQYALWAAWHPSFGDLTLDYVNDTEHRDFAPTQPQDAVTYQTPQVVFTYAHPFGKRALADIGYGNYAMRGSWGFGAETNVDYQQSIGFIGAQYAETQNAIVLAQLRRVNFTGLPSQAGGPPPNYSGSVLVFEQRYDF